MPNRHSPNGDPLSLFLSAFLSSLVISHLSPFAATLFCCSGCFRIHWCSGSSSCVHSTQRGSQTSGKFSNLLLSLDIWLYAHSNFKLAHIWVDIGFIFYNNLTHLWQWNLLRYKCLPVLWIKTHIICFVNNFNWVLYFLFVWFFTK